MRIQLIIHHELDANSGAAGGVEQICVHYREAGHNAEIYSWSDLPAWLSPRQKQLLFPLFVALRLFRGMRRESFDVVDASTGDTWLWSMLDPARRRTLLVTTSHGLEHTAARARLESAKAEILRLSWKYGLYYGGIHLREVEFTLRHADLVFLLNREDLSHAVERLGVDSTRARVVRNGIRDSLQGVRLEATPLGPEEPIGIAQAGSYTTQKGHAYGAEALVTTLRRWPSAFVTFLGTGVDEDVVLRDFEPAFHHRLNVIRRYENSDLLSHLRGHQIVLFPTLSEGFGTTLLEAMACGLAPVSTATPGPSEFVRSEENGLLVDPRSSEALATALDRLMEDRHLLDRLRRSAHATTQSYTWRAAALERLAHYEHALAVKSERAEPVAA